MHLDGHGTRGGPCQMQAERIRMRDTTITALLGYGFSILLPKGPVIWHVIGSVYDSRITRGDSAVEPKWLNKCPSYSMAEKNPSTQVAKRGRLRCSMLEFRWRARPKRLRAGAWTLTII